MALNLYLKDGFESTSLFLGGRGFESTTLFLGGCGLEMGLSPHLCFGGDVGLSLQICFWGVVGLSPFFVGSGGGHSDRVVTLSPPTSGAGVRSPSRPQVGKLVVACRWSAVYSTEP